MTKSEELQGKLKLLAELAGAQTIKSENLWWWRYKGDIPAYLPGLLGRIRDEEMGLVVSWICRVQSLDLDFDYSVEIGSSRSTGAMKYGKYYCVIEGGSDMDGMSGYGDLPEDALTDAILKWSLPSKIYLADGLRVESDDGNAVSTVSRDN